MKGCISQGPNNNVIWITESEIRNMVRESVECIIAEEYPNVFQIGKWKCVVGGDIYEIEGKGDCQGIRMYMDMSSKDKTTFCLFKRRDNGKFFYSTIVPAPERGPRETKFLTVPVSKVPREIRQDFVHPHH